MQEYKRIDISKDQIVPIAERMRKQNVYLVMIHAFINKEGLLDVSWDYAVDPGVESYHVVGETTLPSIGEIYDAAAGSSAGTSSREDGSSTVGASPASAFSRDRRR